MSTKDLNIGKIEPYNGNDPDTECVRCGSKLETETEKSSWGTGKCDDCMAEHVENHS